MKKKIHYSTIDGNSVGFYALVAILGLVVAIGLGAAYYMEHHGHWVTGMNNQIVWGMPHVFAIFLIVAASGALNVASIGSVFKKYLYKPLARLSAILAIVLLAGGLMVLVLDLGHPDRLIVAMTYYNFKSIFAWNIYLYTGFFAIVAVYIWTMMDRTVYEHSRKVGIFAFIWRLALTTGTGSIFGFLVAKQHFDAAIMAPMFVIMSFSFGLAIYLLVLLYAYRWTGRPLGDIVVNRLKNLLGVFVAAVLYFVVVKHLTSLYATEHHGVEKFILMDGGIYTFLFWVVQIGLGSILPLVILFTSLSKSRAMIILASILVIIGGMAQIYVILIGGQAYPLVMFPGMEVSSTFFDGVVGQYSPTLPEALLGFGGVAVALLAVTFAIKVLRFLPESLADNVIDPHFVTEKEAG
ncbi:MAG TPA: molybdopterin oxidoreductase [Chromatiales bacterium]|nr:molybdopterin oxidoreductase [Thiotrichales bacterium]HIP68463.1 molybdopterin oxidoreductase [Chromatiales bacterium]